MSSRSTLLWLGLFAIVVLLSVRGGGLLGRNDDDRLEASIGGRVVRVVDGDTVRIRLDKPHETRTVRYIGVDTPETVKPNTPVQCFGKKASAYNHRLVDGERVRLRFDAERRDRYGRLLAYVYRDKDGLFVNSALVENGYATTLTIPPNVAHADDFRALERRAREAGKGLWREC